MNKKRGFIYYNIAGLKVLFKLERKAMIVYCVLQLIHGFSFAAQVFSLQKFYDTITIYDSIEKKIVIPLYLVIMGAFFLLAQIMNGVANSYGQVLNERVQKGLNGILYKRIALMNSDEFEHPQRLDTINKAVNGCQAVFWVSTALLDIIFFYLSYFGMMSYCLFKMQPILGFSVILAFIPNVISYFIHMVSFRKLENQVAPMRRKNDAYISYMTGKEYVKETRNLGLYHFFEDKYKKVMVEMNKLTMKIQYRKGIIDVVVCILTMLFYGSIIFMAYQFTLSNRISPGSFAAVLVSLRQFYGFMYELIEERFAWASQNVISIENYLKCVEGYQIRPESIYYEKGTKVEFHDISFSYPSVERKALDISYLEIPFGQTIALVGENGSGKSTLCSIIEGLYSPDKGEIYYTQNNKRHSIIGKKRNGISAVFQKYMQYRMTIRENIVISDNSQKKGDIKEICEDVGIKLDNNGVEAMLGKEFGGIELSGGQWQRVALARGVYRDCNMIIMDEPTSAIDPIEESMIFEKIYEYAKDKTAIIVTHRMALARLADRILVMKNGKIVQDGSHNELISVEGEYQKLYQTQMQWYVDSSYTESK